MQFESVDQDQIEDDKLVRCPMCGGIVHTDYIPTHRRFHSVAGGVLEPE